jgi:hypothetical protein
LSLKQAESEPLVERRKKEEVHSSPHQPRYVGANPGKMHVVRKTHSLRLRLDLSPQLSVTNQEEVDIWPALQNGISDLKKKAVILGMIEAADVSYNRGTAWDSQLGANLASIDGLAKWSQVQTEAQNLKAIVRPPVLSK